MGCYDISSCIRSEAYLVEKIKNELWNGVIGGVILTYMVQPSLGFGWSLITGLASRGHSGLLDIIYKGASYGFHENSAANLQNSYFTLVVGICFLGALTTLGFSLPKPQSFNLNNTAEIQPIWAKLKSIFPISKTFFIIAMVIGIIDGLLGLVLGLTEHSLISSYHHRLTILAPKISEQEEEEIRAQWATMQNKREHRAITLRMDQLAKEHKITLPKASTLWD